MTGMAAVAEQQGVDANALPQDSTGGPAGVEGVQQR
jgi:hypothetical protein